MEERKRNKQCLALTRAGSQCKNSARPGSEFCRVHSNSDEPGKTDQLAGNTGIDETISDPATRRQLIEELDDLMVRVRKVIPDYSPPPYPDADTLETPIDQSSEAESTRRPSIIERFLGVFSEDLLDQETWRGIWYMANYTLAYQSDMLKRRVKGDYETDEWGLDWELVEATRPFLDFLSKYFWRVESTGMENIPDYDRTLLVCNHTDQPPWDSTLLMTTILNEHPAQRLVRNLYSEKIPALPFLSSLMVKTSQAVDSVDNGVRLLEQDELVSVFPEGFSRPGRNYQDSYKVSRFRDTGFVHMALKSKTPIVPVSIVSSADRLISRSRRAARQRVAEYPMLADLLPFKRGRFGSPMPLPNKMTIEFGEPISLAEYGPGESIELELNSHVADRVRNYIQNMIADRLEQQETGNV